MAVVASFRDLAPAEVASASLEAAGIPNLLLDSQTIGVDWGYSNALGGIRLHVPDADADEALSLLDAPSEVEWPDLPPGAADEQCSVCGQFAVELDSGPRKTLAVMTGLGFPVWLWRSRLRCRACGVSRRLPLRLRPELLIAWLVVGVAVTFGLAGVVVLLGILIGIVARIMGLQPNGFVA